MGIWIGGVRWSAQTEAELMALLKWLGQRKHS